MLGKMSDISEVGLYEQAERILNVPLGFITALGTVMMPRMSNLVHKGKNDDIKNYIEKSIEFISFLTLPIIFGLISTADDFIPLFLGKDFSKAAVILKFLSTTLVFVSFANVLRTQFLIPTNKDKEYTLSVILGAVVNFTANLLLIPKWNSIGACIGTILAESTVCIYQSYALRKNLPIFKYIADSIPFLIKAIGMFILVSLVSYANVNVYIKILMQVFTGIFAYFILNIRYINKILKIRKK